MFSPGAVISGRYRLLRVLGKGGMGAVWAARNEMISRDVAIKVMLPQAAEDPASLQRFFTEARICGAIRHPGIVDVIDMGRAEDGSPFLVMELLEGDSLEARIHREGRLPPAVILPVVRDIARTLALAHDRGVVHRDIKPANLFLHRLPTGEVVVKVLDFGISKVASPEGAMRATRTGSIVGSPAYMSPEQALGRRDLDGRTDIYSLGIVLYEALAGRLPYKADNYNALIIEIATQGPPPLESRVPGLPRPVLELVRDALVKDPDRRIPSMSALADRIDGMLPLVGAAAARAGKLPAISTLQTSVPGVAVNGTLSSAPTLALSAGAAGASRRWLPLGAAALGVVAVGVAAAVLLGGAPDPQPSSASSAAGEGRTAEALPDPLAPQVLPVATAPVSAAPVSEPEPAPAVSSAVRSSPTAAPGSAPRKPAPAKPSGGGRGAWDYD